MIARGLTRSVVASSLAVSALLLAASESTFAQQQPQQMTFLKPNQINLLKLLPPPPPPDSEEQKKDMAEVMEIQSKRTPAGVARAEADNVLSIWVYSDVLGPNFKTEKLPITTQFFATMHADARIVLSQTKDAWARRRPPAENPEIIQLGGRTRLPYGYPSGTTMFGSLTAIILANMVPEKQFELFERSNEYSHNRTVLGVHYPRDAIAGQLAATVAAHAFFEVPFFREEYAGAREELRRVLGYPEDPTSSIKPRSEVK